MFAISIQCKVARPSGTNVLIGSMSVSENVVKIRYLPSPMVVRLRSSL